MLASNATTGYAWQFAKPAPPEVSLLSSDYETDRPVLPGTGGRQVWTFRAVSTGDTSVLLEYVRPFDRAMIARTTPVTFRITITP